MDERAEQIPHHEQCQELGTLSAFLGEGPRLETLKYLATNGFTSPETLASELAEDSDELKQHLDALAHYGFVSLDAGTVGLGNEVELRCTAEKRRLLFTTLSGAQLVFVFPKNPKPQRDAPFPTLQDALRFFGK